MGNRALTRICGILLAGVCATSLAQPPGGPQFQELGHIASHFRSAGAGRIAVADLDHDGVSDLVFDAVATNSIVYVVGDDGSGSLGIKQALVTPDTEGEYGWNYGYARVLAWQQGPGTKIVTVATNGIARVFSGWPLREEGSFAIVDGAVSAALGDADGDGGSELLVLTTSAVHSYSLSDGSGLWSYSISSGSDIALAQLDADVALEMIIAGPVPGLVLDGATRSTDWSYIDGFGNTLATGVFVAGSSTQWVGADSWYSFTTFQSDPWSPMWDFATSNDIAAIATGDLDGLGVDSIVYGDGQWGDVHVIDPATQQERFYITNDGYSIRAIAIADLNGDGTPDISFLSNGSGSDGSLITTADGVSGETLWQLRASAMPYRVATIGDVDGDGMNEIVASSSGDSYDGSVSIFDFATGNLEWQSPGEIYNADNPFAIDVRSIELVPHADESGMNIVLAGGGSYYGKIVVLDGVDKVVIRQIGDYQTPLVPHYIFTGIALMDFDGDGTKDYVVAAQAASSGASGNKLQVISGASDTLLWESVGMGSGNAVIHDVLVVPPSTPGAASQLIAVMSDSLRAYDSETELLDWVLATTNNGAAFIEEGLSGPEIMTYQSSGAVTFYDANTQAYLRAFALDSPLSQVTVLQGDVRTLLAASDQGIKLVDGSNGSVLASSAPLGELWTNAPFAAPAASPLGGSSWYVAMPAVPALWRFRLDASDRIFLGTFDSP